MAQRDTPISFGEAPQKLFSNLEYDRFEKNLSEIVDWLRVREPQSRDWQALVTDIRSRNVCDCMELVKYDDEGNLLFEYGPKDARTGRAGNAKYTVPIRVNIERADERTRVIECQMSRSAYVAGSNAGAFGRR